MRPVRARLRTLEGQVIVFVVAIQVVLIGMGALVIDGGRWFQTQRHLQTAADAAALAGVQNLPSDPTTAQSIANTYAQDNYNGATAAVSTRASESSRARPYQAPWPRSTAPFSTPSTSAQKRWRL